MAGKSSVNKRSFLLFQSNEEKENTLTVNETSVKKVFVTPKATPKPFRKKSQKNKKI